MSSTIKLTWDVVEDAYGYDIYHSESSGLSIAHTPLLASVNSTTYNHEGLSVGSENYYIIAAVGPNGELGPRSIEVHLTIVKLLVSIIVTPNTAISLNVASTLQFTATGHYNDLTTNDITNDVAWSSTDPTKATINSVGLATGILHGSTDIMATLGPVSITPIVLTIVRVLQTISLSPLAPSVVYPNTQQFTATGHYNDLTTADLTNAVIWASSDTSKATIDGYGLATSILNGSTNISASLGLVSAAPTTLTISRLLTSISLSPSLPQNLYIGNTLQFTATAHYNDTSTMDITSFAMWNSSDTSKATVDGYGLTTGILTGATNITVTFSAMSSPATIITVVPILQSIVITPINLAILVGNTQQFTATGHYNDSSTANITSISLWASADNAVATIDAYGLATGVSKGAVQISASLLSIDGYDTLNVLPSSNIKHWVKADVGVTKDGSNNVLAWLDQSGNGTNWGTPTNGYVTWTANQLNSLPVLRSPGGTNVGTPAPYLSQAGFMPTSNTNAPGEVFVVLKTAASVDPAYSWAGFSTQNQSSHYPFGGDIYENFGIVSRQSHTPPTLSTPRGGSNPCHSYNIYNISSGGSGGSYFMRLGGLQFFAPGSVNSGWASTFNLFASNTAAPPAFGFNGDIAEIIMYGTTLGDGDIAIILNYLQAKYAL